MNPWINLSATTSGTPCCDAVEDTLHPCRVFLLLSRTKSKQVLNLSDYQLIGKDGKLIKVHYWTTVSQSQNVAYSIGLII